MINTMRAIFQQLVLISWLGHYNSQVQTVEQAFVQRPKYGTQLAKKDLGL